MGMTGNVDASVGVGRRLARALGIAVVAILALSAASSAAIGDVTHFSVTTGFKTDGSAAAITSGPDGNLWFVESSRVGRITTAGSVTEFTAGISSDPGLNGIAAGADGNLWFTESAGNRIGRITPSGVVTEFSAGISPGAHPDAIAAGPDGNVWFTEYADRIGRITPAGVVTEFSAGISTGADLRNIAAGPDGNLWFTERLGNRIGRITPAGVVTEFSAGLSATAYPVSIAAGPDGNLWFTEDGGGLGRITPAGVVTELLPRGFPFLTAAITGGPDGNLWLVQTGLWYDSTSGTVAFRVTPSGVSSAFDVESRVHSFSDIVAGPDGNVWIAGGICTWWDEDLCSVYSADIWRLTTNLAPDPDFGVNPLGSYFTNGPATFSWASDQARTGMGSVKIVSATNSLSRWLSKPAEIPVAPGSSYTACAFLKTANAGTPAYLAVNYWTAAQAYVSPSTVGSQARVGGTSDWTRVCVTSTAPDGAAYLRVELRLPGTGTLWADDVSVMPSDSIGPPVLVSPPFLYGAGSVVGDVVLTTDGEWLPLAGPEGYQWFACDDAASVPPSPACSEIPGATAGAYVLTAGELGKWVRARVRVSNAGGTGEAYSNAIGPVSAPLPAGNLAPDPDFEASPYTWYSTNGSGTFNWRPNGGHSGPHALEIISSTNSLSRWLSRPAEIPVTPGSSYTACALLLTWNAGRPAYLAVNYWTAAQTYVSPSTVGSQARVGGTTDWTQVCVTSTAPAGAAYLRLEFRLPGTGTLWIDDVSVTTP